MNIRHETPADHEAIRRINVEAFRNHPVSRQTEHLIVEGLRRAGALEISLVAELEGAVVGHIAFSLATVGGRDLGWRLLGPLAVLPELQRRGIGSALVRAGLGELRRLGAAGCALVGDPAYYARLDFRQCRGLSWPGVPEQYVLCLPLAAEGPGGEPEGALGCHPAFHVGPESAT